MTILLEKLSTVAACVVIILSYSSSVVLSVPLFSNKQKDGVIQIENKAFELQCSVTGTKADIDRITKIEWKRPGSSSGSEILIEENDPNRTITVDENDVMYTSTLRLKKPSADGGRIQFYVCTVVPSLPAGISEHNFPITVLQAKAEPKIRPIPLEPGKVGKTSVLKCFVSYENDYPRDYNLALSWTKNGNALINATIPYKKGTITEEISVSVLVNSFRNGGEYVCQWKLAGKNTPNVYISGKEAVTLTIVPHLNGPASKEVEDDQGSDVKLTCDVIGYPIEYEWRDDKNSVIGNKSDARYKPKDEVLYIDDIDYEDRKAFSCRGIGPNGTIEQIIILRVKDPLRVLYPIIGILVEIVIVAAIILFSEYYKKRQQSEKDGAGIKNEITDQPSTSQT